MSGGPVVKAGGIVCAALGLMLSCRASVDDVCAQLSLRERPDKATLLTARAELGSGSGRWNLVLVNRRGHGAQPRTFSILSDSGRSAGFCGLASFLGLTVNGIPSSCLQVRREWVREFVSKEGKGLEFALNFDGAVVRMRLWMQSGLPRLWGEVCCSERGLEPVTNLVVRVTALPSYLDEGRSRPTRFSGYRRSVRTACRYLPPTRKANIVLKPEDRFLVLQDEEDDGTDRGGGPSAVFFETPVRGTVELSDGWLTSVHFTPDPAKPFRFSLLDYNDRESWMAEFADGRLTCSGGGTYPENDD